MKKLLFFTFLAFLPSCWLPNQGLSTLAMSDINVDRLSALRVGMSQKEVLQIMRKPYSYETFTIDKNIYDVWFYVTRPTILGQSRMVHQNLTPLAFKNGVYLGTGYSYYNYYVEHNQTTLEVPHENEPVDTESEPEKMNDEESETDPSLTFW